MRDLNTKIKAAVQPTKPKPTQMLPDNMTWAWDPNGNSWVAVMKESDDVTAPLYSPNTSTTNGTTTSTTTSTGYMSTVKSSDITDLNKFLDSELYSKETTFNKELITSGMLEYAGYNPYRGVKYRITDKGLKVLKEAALRDYNKELNSYLLDNINEGQPQSGDAIYQGKMPQLFDIFEKDGSCLAQGIEADNETDAKLKFMMKYPEYDGSQTITAKLVKKDNKWQAQSESGRSFGTYDTKEEAKERLKQMEMFKHMKSNFIETTEQGYDYPSKPAAPFDDITLENHDGWVNTANKVKPEFAKLHDLLGQYRKAGFIIDINELDGNLVVLGEPEFINNLEHEVKDIGYHCEAVDETTNYEPIWALKIFMK